MAVRVAELPAPAPLASAGRGEGIENSALGRGYQREWDWPSAPQEMCPAVL